MGSYVGVAFVGAVSYFVSIWVKEPEGAFFTDYLDRVAEIYVIEEIVTPAIGYYVLFLGKFLCSM
jgi:hypothetical protein